MSSKILNCHAAYKDSHIPWIGEIPKHWEMRHLKRLVEIKGGKDSKKVELDNGLYPIYGSGGVFGRTNSYLYKKPSVLLGRKGTIDKPLLVTEPFWSVDTMYYTIIKRHVDPKFLYYVCLTIQFGLYKYGSAIPSMSSGELNQILFAIPQQLEQILIATYLDKKTAQIDRKIKLLNKKEKLYKQLKQSLIHETVTRGLDKSVPMKDSDDEWLGNLPKHWTPRKISHEFKKIGSGTTPKSGLDKYYDNGNINWINSGDLNDGYLNKCKRKITTTAFQNNSLTMYPPNSLIVAMYGATIGKVTISKIDGCTNQACCVLYGSKTINIKYLFYWFIAKRQFIISLGYGGGQPNISQDTIKNSRVICPDYAKQIFIVKYLEEKTDKINKIIENTYNQIDNLKKLRKTLINDVVTGKIKITSNETIQEKSTT